MNTKTRNMVGLALFTAIVVVLQLLAVGLRALGLFSISLVLVPIVVGSAVYGWKGGAWLGFVFGVAVLLSGDAAAFLAVDVAGTVLVVLAKGTFCGLAAGLIYKLLEKYNKLFAVTVAAIVCPVVNTGIFLFFCSFVLFALIGVFLVKPFFLAQTDVEEILHYGTSYTSICLICSIGIFGQFCFERLLQSTGRTNLSMISQIVGAVTNIILDPILIFGLLGFPRMEVAGAAVATVIGQMIAAVLALYLNLKKNPEVHILPSRIRFDRVIAQEIYRVGLPSIIMQSIGSVMTFCMNKILIAFTTTATAVFGAYFKLQSFIFMPIFGLNNAMVPIIAYNFGAAKPKRVRKTIKLSILSAVGIMFVGLVAFEAIPGVLLSFFDASDRMLEIGIPALRIIGTHFLLAGICIPSNSVCQAIGNPTHSLICSVCRQLVVLLPAAWLLSRTGRLELVWLAFPIAELVAVTMSSLFLRKTIKNAEAIMASGHR